MEAAKCNNQAGHRNPQSPYSRAANQKTGGAQAAHVPMIEGTDLLKDPAATEALLEDKWAGGAGFAFIDSILGSRTNAVSCYDIAGILHSSQDASDIVADRPSTRCWRTS